MPPRIRRIHAQNLDICREIGQFIQRQTDKGLPAYDPSDIFVTAAGEELVPLEDGSFGAFHRSSSIGMRKW